MNLNETLNNKLAGVRSESHASNRAVDNIRLELDTLNADEKRVNEVHGQQRAKLVAEIEALDKRRDAQLDDIRASRAILQRALEGFDQKEQVLAKAADISNAAEAVSKAINTPPNADDGNKLVEATNKINSGQTA